MSFQNNHLDKAYNRWRNAVLTRDGRKCRFPNCGVRSLRVCHIRPPLQFPLLRDCPTNGIVLCDVHQALVKGQEAAYEGLLRQAVASSASENDELENQILTRRYGKKTIEDENTETPETP